jgi:hypothetical protein
MCYDLLESFSRTRYYLFALAVPCYYFFDVTHLISCVSCCMNMTASLLNVEDVTIFIEEQGVCIGTILYCLCNSLVVF